MTLKKSFLQKINKTLASVMLLGLPLTNSVQIIHALEQEQPIVHESSFDTGELTNQQADMDVEKTDASELNLESEEGSIDLDIIASDSESAVKEMDETAKTLEKSHQEADLSLEEGSNDSSIEDKDYNESDDSQDSPTYHSLKESTPTSEVDQAEQVAEFTMEDYKKASAVEMAQLIKEGLTTPEQLLEYAYEMIKITNPELNNIITLRPEMALEELAAMQDTELPFYGVPILVKGLGHTVAGGSNSNGVEYLKDQVSSRTGSFVRKLQEAGFVVIGQTSYPQYGWINVTNSDLYGNTHNPWNSDHNPGGSSGGSSAGVAIGQVPIATTSDAGGSTRIPASFTGLIGLHPSRGILEGNSTSANSQTSHFAIMDDMDDLNLLFDVLLKDRFTEEVNDPTIQLSKDLPIAYTFNTPAGTPIDMEAIQAVRNTVDFLEKQGYTLVEVDYPIDGKAMMYDYYTIAASGATSLSLSANRILGRPLERDDVELLTWALYQTGQELDREDIDLARENVARMTEKLAEFYSKYPVLLTAATAYPAPAADYNHIPEEYIPIMEDMSQLTKEEKMDVIYEQWLPAWTKTPYTQLSNLTGTPSLSLPTHLTADGLPLGVLFNAGLYQDRLLLQIGELFNNHDLLITYYRTENKIEEVSTPYQVEYIFTNELNQGETQIKTSGESGKVVSLYAVEYEGTVEVGRQLLDETVFEPVSQVILIGTKIEEPKENPSKSNGDNDTEPTPLPDIDTPIIEDENEVDFIETDFAEEVITDNFNYQEITTDYIHESVENELAGLQNSDSQVILFEPVKRQALTELMEELGAAFDQEFESYSPEHQGEMLGYSFPTEVLEYLAIENQPVPASWAENGSHTEKGEYAVVAAYHNGTHYYLFAFIDGEPVVLESQQTELKADGLIHFHPTEDEVLQNAFEEIAGVGISIS